MTTTFTYQNSSGHLVQWPKYAFSKLDLEILAVFLSQHKVLPLTEINRGMGGPGTVAMRHDVDHSIAHALKFAEWEHERGIRSTYFLLHSAWYYEDFSLTVEVARMIESYGHEIGFHNDCVGVAAKRYGSEMSDTFKVGAAGEIMRSELMRLRDHFDIVGCADHGGGYPDLQTKFWQEYQPSDFGFEYEAYQLASGQNYISDNRGVWREPLKDIEDKQTHVLVHPCHWPV